MTGTMTAAVAAPSILVVEDTEQVRRMLLSWLKLLGYKAEGVASGREALTLARQGHYDVIITDILMPDGDGLELLSALRRHRKPVAVIAISGGGEFLGAEQCLLAAEGLGATFALPKPFTQEELTRVLDLALQSQQSDS